MQQLIQLFESFTKENVLNSCMLTPAGSNRVYVRLRGASQTLVGVIGTSVEENEAFYAISQQFTSKGINAPRVYAVSPDRLCYLIDDLGDESLFDAIKEGVKTGDFSENEQALLLKTIQALPAIQFKGAAGFDFSVCYPQPVFNKRSVHWDLNYFKYCFLKPADVDFNEDCLEDEFDKLADILTQEETDTFLYRDFQSRNVMLLNDNPYFIDFQGGRKGPVYYDVASFVYQAKANYPKALKEKLLQAYWVALTAYMPVNESDFRQKLSYFLLFRTLQVLGAYGYRGYFEKKSHFLQSVPFALDNLKEILLENDFNELGYLCSILGKLVNKSIAFKDPEHNGLLVKVYSFSYKKGIPDDYSGNGGGFVFDCRAIHNPGRYEAYKRLTGRDKPVVDYLEEDGEITAFLHAVYALADSSVSRYIERGFTNLQFAFGCTGGQHRSVYGAERLASYLADRFDITVELIHRELKIKEIK